MVLDLQRILLGGTRLIGAIRDYTDPTTVTTWKSKKNFSRGGLIGLGMASNFHPRVSLTRFTQVSQETLFRILNTLQLRSDNLTRNQSHAHLFGALSQLP